MTSSLLFILHFLGDFLFQNDWMALNKSKSNKALTAHVLVYSLCFLPFYGLKFWFVTFCFHWVTDYFTSREIAKLWFFVQCGESDTWRYAEGKRHWFFVGIGMDQLIHYLTLTMTYWAICA